MFRRWAGFVTAIQCLSDWIPFLHDKNKTKQNKKKQTDSHLLKKAAHGAQHGSLLFLPLQVVVKDDHLELLCNAQREESHLWWPALKKVKLNWVSAPALVLCHGSHLGLVLVQHAQVLELNKNPAITRLAFQNVWPQYYTPSSSLTPNLFSFLFFC